METVQPNSSKKVQKQFVKADSVPVVSTNQTTTPSPPPLTFTTPTDIGQGNGKASFSNSYVTLPASSTNRSVDTRQSLTSSYAAPPSTNVTPRESYQTMPHPSYHSSLEETIKPLPLPRSRQSTKEVSNSTSFTFPNPLSPTHSLPSFATCPDGPVQFNTEEISPYVEPNALNMPVQQSTSSKQPPPDQPPHRDSITLTEASELSKC